MGEKQKLWLCSPAMRVAFAVRSRTCLMVQAGNSGLCGGSVPLADEVILLTGKMDKVIAFDEVSTISAAYYKLLN